MRLQGKQQAFSERHWKVYSNLFSEVVANVSKREQIESRGLAAVARSPFFHLYMNKTAILIKDEFMYKNFSLITSK